MALRKERFEPDSLHYIGSNIVDYIKIKFYLLYQDTHKQTHTHSHDSKIKKNKWQTGTKIIFNLCHKELVSLIYKGLLK